VTSVEEKFASVDSLKSAIEMIQQHIESMGSPEEEKEMGEHTEDEEKEVMASEEKEEEMTEEFESATQEVEEQLSAEEETNELEVEEQFAAEQKAEEVAETVEDKTVVFNGITPEKVNMINNFFNRK